MDYSAWDKKRQNFSVDKGNLRYLREGKGPTLLLIHGFPTSSWDFAWIFPKLVLEYDCIAADLMGLGSSTTSSSRITIADQVDALEALLKYLDVDQAHLLAHDLGDTVALEFLARKKEGHNDFQWLSCAMLNGGIFQEANQPRPIQHLLNSPLGPIVAQLSPSYIFSRNMKRIFGPSTPPSKHFLNTSWELLLANQGRKMLPKLSYYLTERKRYKRRWEQPLFEPIIPMAMINGIHDPVSGRAILECFAEKVPNGFVFPLNLGHYPHVESPKAVLEAFAAFHTHINPQ